MKRVGLRFHLDECVPPAVAAGLRKRGLDVTTSQEAELLEATDDAQLAFATREERVLVTQDAGFLALARSTARHSGIAYYRAQSLPVGAVIDRLADLGARASHEEMARRIEFLPAAHPGRKGRGK
ncbi:MAG: DUF5615 family PIN-like protein [Acidobacteriota bacterium]|nr:DUF5615 family PIN-like protein [Acidobacteriota bacterium]